jgi:hypothetical protein
VKIMQFATLKYARSAIVVAGLAIAGALTGSAQADVITTSATLPLIGVPYTSPSGAGCFTLAGVCVTPGTFVQTLPVSSMISMGNQLIVTGATYDASLTTVGGTVPIGSVALTGTVDETVFGRTSLTETGTFPTELTGLSLMGILTFVNPSNPLNGDTVVATLGSTTSTGSTTITSLQRQEFRISSFFDVFIDVSIPGTIFSKSVGPILVVAVPEPSTWAMLLVGFAGLGFAALRRAARSA